MGTEYILLMADEPKTDLTVSAPTDHFPEYLYTLVVCLLLCFVIFMSHVHNDSLASKGMDFVYLILGALTQSSTGGAKRQ